MKPVPGKIVPQAAVVVVDMVVAGAEVRAASIAADVAKLIRLFFVAASREAAKTF